MRKEDKLLGLREEILTNRWSPPADCSGSPTVCILACVAANASGPSCPCKGRSFAEAEVRLNLCYASIWNSCACGTYVGVTSPLSTFLSRSMIFSCSQHKNEISVLIFGRPLLLQCAKRFITELWNFGLDSPLFVYHQLVIHRPLLSALFLLFTHNLSDCCFFIFASLIVSSALQFPYFDR